MKRSSPLSTDAPRRRPRPWLTPALMLAALLLGGGSMGAALADTGFMIAGTIVSAMLVAAHETGRRPLPANWPLLLSPILLVMALAIFQLLPLGLGSASELGGFTDRLRQLAGLEGSHLPVSMDPDATWRVFGACLYPLACALAMLGSGRRERQLSLLAIVGGFALSVLVAGLQVALPHQLAPIHGPFTNASGGLFANANHQAVGLSVGLLAAGAAMFGQAKADDWRGPTALLAVAIWLGIGIAMARSVAGSIFFVASAAMLSILWVRWRTNVLHWQTPLPRHWMWYLPAIGFFTLGASLYLTGFRLLPTARVERLQGFVDAIGSAMPFGSGLGTFAPVYARHEPLDLVFDQYFNHAHVEPLQWVMETGLPGLIGALVVGIVALRLVARRWAAREAHGRNIHLILVVAVLIVLAHGLVEYPLRTVALAAVTAALYARVVLDAERRGSGGSMKARPWAAYAIAGVAAAGLLAILTPKLLSHADYQDGRVEEAVALDGDNGRALAALARERVAEEPEEARRLAREAIDAAPLQSDAMLALLLADPRAAASREVLSAVSALGWRNDVLQLALFDFYLQAGAPEQAARHAAAAMRMGRVSAAMAPLARAASNDPAFVGPFVRHLGARMQDATTLYIVDEAEGEAGLDGAYALLLTRSQIDRPVNPNLALWTYGALFAQDRPVEAAALHARMFPDRDALSIMPYRAAPDRVPATAFDFQSADPQRVRLRLTGPASAPALSVRSMLVQPATLVRRRLALTGGNHLARLDLKSDRDARVALVLDCDGSSTRVEAQLERGEIRRVTMPIALSGTDCSAPFLRIDVLDRRGLIDLDIVAADTIPLRKGL